MPDDQTLHCDARGEGHGKGQRQSDDDRNRVVWDDLLHHVTGVGAHHNEFAMGHVNDTHDAKRNGQADGRKKVD